MYIGKIAIAKSLPRKPDPNTNCCLCKMIIVINNDFETLNSKL